MISTQELPEKRLTEINSVPLTSPLNPGWLVLVTIIAGLAASGPLAGIFLFRCGYRKSAWAAGAGLGLIGIIIFCLAPLWDVEWYWTALVITAINISCGTALYFALQKPFRRFRELNPLPEKEYGSYRHIISGIVGGFCIGVVTGILFAVVYLVILDRIFSTIIPVTFEDEYAAFRFTAGWLFFTLSGTVAGGFVGRFKPDIKPLQIILYTLILAWAQFSWLAMVECCIAVPGFQAGAATGGGWKAIMAPFIIFNMFIGFWWPIFLLYFIASQDSATGKLSRAFQAVGINFAAGLLLSITFGYTTDMFLAAGIHLERSASTKKALWCYEHGLSKKPDSGIASYLQYRVSLLYHKLGDREKTIQGFTRLVAKYNANTKLVRKANRFLDSLGRSEIGKRVVLPGVESQTEYKGAYCVPNSLAVVMRYWGSEITARSIGKKITGLGSGTYAASQCWFAEQKGFKHEFLPMASRGDIIKCIDAGLPVLVYVPSHVFVIVGYDNALETFVTYDVATHDIWEEYIQEDFIKAWKRRATTMVLVYPPDKSQMIPEDIRTRLLRLSDNYLHFQFYYFDAPENDVSIPHLLKAAGDTGEFFLPVTILASDYPGLQTNVLKQYDPEFISSLISQYFGEDFDEGIHSWGQYHDQRRATHDWALTYGVEYLLIHKKFSTIEALINKINEEGQISSDMLMDIGIISFAGGKFRQGLDRLAEADNQDTSLYEGLARMKIRDSQGAVRKLVEELNGFIWQLSRRRGKSRRSFNDMRRKTGLDRYGFPSVAIANKTLVQMSNYGESRETLENNWKIWIHHVPFDSPVAKTLARLMENRLKKLHKRKDAAVYQRLARELRLVKMRAERYDWQEKEKL